MTADFKINLKVLRNILCSNQQNKWISSKKVKVGNDQEMAQSERYSHSTNRGAGRNKMTFRYLQNVEIVFVLWFSVYIKILLVRSLCFQYHVEFTCSANGVVIPRPLDLESNAPPTGCN